ncbi:glyco_hydro_56 domain-containing protein isoform X1 [Cyprinodon tularosa]|uniref:glyco_hydro_56 domain-containing protein isoform X1 n=1 Tax=Cyprinodon tularosa TaxID=77115 RepID=UPI0018E1E006|nr:glyco_hydro_56 domain-containing protein isoform X1 [Cyprinodon tularosa]
MAWTEPQLNPDPKPLPRQTQHSPLLYSSLLVLISIGYFAGLCNAGPADPARLPLLSGQPFIIFWGISDSSCVGRLNPTSFGMEQEGRVAVFYEDSLGNYPYFLDKNTPVNGGIPQYTRLDAHVQKTKLDLEAALPAPRYLGLGVLRWAEWVPQWSRNPEKQALYQEASRKLLRSFFPKWTPEEVEKWSQVDFEAAAQSVMVETLREVKRLRPKALWGFSPYPSCYNSDPAQTQLANYTGQCPAAEMALNDELLWLWRRSSALFPLLTLEKRQGGTEAARSFLSSQIKEALRIASLAAAEFDLPVFPLVKSVYASTKTFLSQADLINTIGESAAMGTAGVVIWNRSEMKTERECQDLAVFVRKVLGPYSLNVTTATQSCSASLCQGKGRCVRQNAESSAYLHLPAQPSVAEKTTEKAEGAEATEQPDAGTKAAESDPAEIWKKDFQCQWYKTADKETSERQPPKDGVSVGGKAEGSTGNAAESRAASTTKSASETMLGGSDFGGTGRQAASLEVQTDSVTAPNLHALLLLLGAGFLCL